MHLPLIYPKLHLRAVFSQNFCSNISKYCLFHIFLETHFWIRQGPCFNQDWMLLRLATQ